MSGKILEKERGTVCFNGKAWEVFNSLLSELNASKIFLIVDSNTKQHCLPYFVENISQEFVYDIIEFKAGEEHKNIDTCLSIWDKISDKGGDRNSLIINLGGGVVTDLGGFIACTFKRGVEFINIPTSLLAMVDASIGGKNGIDLGVIKNQIGIIKPAKLVLVDTQFLRTLSQEHLLSGKAEMLKHGLIDSDPYWKSIKELDIQDRSGIVERIWESICIKDRIVTKDPYEERERKLLNYGHTLGHAIESYSLKNNQFQSLLHGEAIAIGMILATYLSHRLLNFPIEKLKDVSTTILKIYKKVKFSKMDIQEIMELLIYDKKSRSGKVLFVLLEDIGVFKIDQEVPEELIIKAFDYYEDYR
jgi:3-dehydroquinate synthase